MIAIAFGVAFGIILAPVILYVLASIVVALATLGAPKPVKLMPPRPPPSRLELAILRASAPVERFIGKFL